ncbi:MAG: hypothetical protein EPN41_03420 [Candidimonas sp.]|nr:MAG: hypothetical protein EPN41_03420 [Candidimonas sp.]
MNRLPLPQQQLWPTLRGVSDLGFVLYGGTAIALRLGHRESVDFDFFSDDRLDRGKLTKRLPFLANASVLQDEPDTWVLQTSPDDDGQAAGVKVSFFCGITFGRVGEPDITEDGVMEVACLEDLMATKLKVLLQRAQAKDYRDIAVMLAAGVDLSRALGAASRLFGTNFQPLESLRALNYFRDGDLETLGANDRKILVQATKAVTATLPSVPLLSHRLSAR